MWDLRCTVWHWDRFFFPPSRPTSSFPSYNHSINSSYLFSSTCCSYQDRWAKPGNLLKSVALSEVEEHWVGKYCNSKSLMLDVMLIVRICKIILTGKVCFHCDGTNKRLNCTRACCVCSCPRQMAGQAARDRNAC